MENTLNTHHETFPYSATEPQVNWDEKEVLHFPPASLKTLSKYCCLTVERLKENLNQKQPDSPRVFISPAPPLFDLVTVPVLSAQPPSITHRAGSPRATATASTHFLFSLRHFYLDFVKIHSSHYMYCFRVIGMEVLFFLDTSSHFFC